MFFIAYTFKGHIAYTFKGQVHVFAGQVKIITRPAGQVQYLNMVNILNYSQNACQNIKQGRP